jgi:hypothetical protein
VSKTRPRKQALCEFYRVKKIDNQTARDLPKSRSSQKYHKKKESIQQKHHTKEKHLHQHASLLHSVAGEGKNLGASREALCVVSGVPPPLPADREMLALEGLCR